ENGLAVRRHRSIGAAHERRERLERHWIGRQHLAAAGHDRALALEAMALPAAVLHERGLALLGGGRQRAAAAQHEAGGKRRQPAYTYQTHRRPPIPAAASRR